MLDEVLDYNYASKVLEKGNYKKALQLFKKIKAPSKELLNNMGVAYRALGQDAEMLKCFENALSCTRTLDSSLKTDEHILNNLGLAAYMYGDDTKAIEYYKKATDLNPKAWNAWWNRSTAELRIASTTGKGFPQAWEMYRARFLKSPPTKISNMQPGLIYWDGSPNKSVIILTEQGIGDNIMWGRYLSKVKEISSSLYVQTNNYDLFLEYSPVGDAIDCDATVAYPICSLGDFFPDIPPADWLKGKFDTHKFPSGLNIGIVWSGNPGHSNDKYRSVDIRRFHRLAKYANLWSLQPGRGDNIVRKLDINSWTDTAKYVNGLDLVIGVDTSVMHLVGSMGKVGWLLQPYKETDFRWGTVDSSSSVWYPNMKIFNNPQSWETVFDRVEECLQSHVLEFQTQK